MAPKPKRLSNKEIVFSDYPEFRPNLTPEKSFGWAVSAARTGVPSVRTSPKELQERPPQVSLVMVVRIPKDHLTREWRDYDTKINKYGVKVGTELGFWEKKKWIKSSHPYGWVHWYCDFYNGKRGADDARQVKRWEQTAGPRSRFRLALLNRIKRLGRRCDDYEVSPRIRQTLQHWAYQITSRDCQGKGTRRKGTRRKGTRRKGTRRKGTRRKGTRRKGTRRKGTRRKGTRRKGTRRAIIGARRKRRGIFSFF